MNRLESASGGPRPTNVPRHSGLTTAAATKRLAEDGPNLLPTGRRRTWLVIAFEALRQPMFLLLFAATGVYFLLGEFTDGFTLLLFVCASAAITLVQEGRTEKTLAALTALTSPRARVLRDGEWAMIQGSDVVVGDLLRIVEGDRVAADGRVVESEELGIDESLLTGESAPVRKTAGDAAADASGLPRPGGENTPAVFAGTLVVQGQGLARVVATGARSEIGRLGASLGQVSTLPSPLHVQTARLVRAVAVIALVLGVVLAVVHGLLNGDWTAGMLAGIALSMALLPEEYGVVLAVFPALGARRLAKTGVLTRRLSALEALGATSTLCVDKTGTLTENRMRVARLYGEGVEFDAASAGPEAVPPSLRRLGLVAAAASEIEPFDPMERAYRTFAAALPADGGGMPALDAIVHEYALTSEVRAMSHVWSLKSGSGRFVAAKGAPEAVLMLCRKTPAETTQILAVVDAMAARGLRVLGVAEATLDDGAFPAKQSDVAYKFLGLTALADPLRKEAPDAVRRAEAAGVRVVMITGDYPATARAIGREAGLGDDEPLTGTEVATLDDAALVARLRTTHVCARITPDQKLRIVRAFQAGGAIVAMTGDGVNDAPALKAAHVGVSMGKRGSEVAREASALVLLNDDFTALVGALGEGRRIFDNVRRSMSYILAVHVPIAGMAILPVAFGAPTVLFPVHMALLEFVIDPACALVFEAEPAAADAMTRKPRDVSAPLFGKRDMLRAAGDGLAGLVSVAAVDIFARGAMAENEPAARATTFAAIVSANLALILIFRGSEADVSTALRGMTPILKRVLGLALLGLGLALYVPPLAGLLKFSGPGPVALAAGLLGGAAGPVLLELLRRSVRLIRARNGR